MDAPGVEQPQKNEADRALENAEANLHRERLSDRRPRPLSVIEAELALCVSARAALTSEGNVGPEPTEAEVEREPTAVWVVESGEYEQRSIDLVAVSRESAIDAIKALYGPPYVVTWEIDKHGELLGHFKGIRGLSTEHTAVYSIDEWPLTAAHSTPTEDSNG